MIKDKVFSFIMFIVKCGIAGISGSTLSLVLPPTPILMIAAGVCGYVAVNIFEKILEIRLRNELG